jgi:putative copper export protein
MQTLTFDPHRWWMARVVSRNPLIRRTDRLEVVAIVVAIILSVAAIPIAAAVGTTVSESQHRLYVQQAQTRHRVAAARCWLDRIRDGQWESELRTVVGDDGGRTNGTEHGRPR